MATIVVETTTAYTPMLMCVYRLHFAHMCGDIELSIVHHHQEIEHIIYLEYNIPTGLIDALWLQCFTV